MKGLLSITLALIKKKTFMISVPLVCRFDLIHVFSFVCTLPESFFFFFIAQRQIIFTRPILLQLLLFLRNRKFHAGIRMHWMLTGHLNDFYCLVYNALF